MYAIVISVSIKPDRFDEFLSSYANEAMSVIRATPGFGGSRPAMTHQLRVANMAKPMPQATSCIFVFI